MYLLTLPKNCPSSNASENDEITLFRVFEQSEPQESEFQPYVVKYKDNPLFKQKCDAYAVSFFTKFDFALNKYNELKNKNKIMGNYIATIKFSPKIGKIKCNESTGHCNFWFYSEFRVDKHITSLEIRKIEQ